MKIQYVVKDADTNKYWTGEIYNFARKEKFTKNIEEAETFSSHQEILNKLEESVDELEETIDSVLDVKIYIVETIISKS